MAGCLVTVAKGMREADCRAGLLAAAVLVAAFAADRRAGKEMAPAVAATLTAVLLVARAPANKSQVFVEAHGPYCSWSQRWGKPRRSFYQRTALRLRSTASVCANL